MLLTDYASEDSRVAAIKTMKQVVRKGLKEILVEDVPDPTCVPHHVLIRPFFSLISSGTETASIHKDGVMKEVAENPSHLRKIWDVMKVAGPVRTIAEVNAKFNEFAVLGYAGAGVIVDKHSSVIDLEIGESVAYGGEGTGHGETILSARNLTARVPSNVKFEHASFATLGSIALNAVRVAQIGLGESVAVIGQGLVGQLISQLVRLQGGSVVAIDLKSNRVNLALSLGAHYGLSADTAIEENIRAFTDGRGVDCVIIAAAAKSSAPCLQALQICRDRGRIVVVGAVELAFPWQEMYLKEIQLFMSRAYGPGSYDPKYEKLAQDYPISYVRWTENRNMEEFLRLVATEGVKLDPLITHRFPLEEAAKAYQTIMDPSSGSLAVLLNYPASTESDPVVNFRPTRKVELAESSHTGQDVRVGLIGAGNLARWAHLPNIKKHSGVRLRAVYSNSGARGKSYAQRFGADYCASDYETILGDADVDMVMILTRNQHHAAQTIAALQAGKHVFVEKPMALTEDECRQLVKAAETSGKRLTVGFNRRFAPFYIGLKSALAKRTGPAVLNCRINSPGISGDYWMADPSVGGAILGEACHFVDLMYWLLESEPLSVTAFSLPTGKVEPIGENNIVACFRFEDGSIGNLTYCTVGSKTSGGERVEAFAQGIGAFTEDFTRLTFKKNIRTSKTRLWAEKGYAGLLEAFVTDIRSGGQAKAPTVWDGTRATVGCLRMLEAARRRASCELDFDFSRPTYN
jgi:predicted dehydrogenase/threonine dehydrogenase-like Zn-dependent dehydrogenase